MNEPREENPEQPGAFFVTGFPGFIGKRLVRKIATERPTARVYLLVLDKVRDEAEALVATMPNPDRFIVLTGDIVSMHLGLSGAEYERLRGDVTDIFHLAAVSYLGVPRETAWRVNVDGTRNVLELARESPGLARLCYFSTCYVAGDRLGVVAEDELEAGQSFRNAYEETKYQAERLVRRAGEYLPVSIFRPAAVVGDTRTGEIDRFEGPYYLGILLVMSPLVVPLPLPGNGVAPLNIVPVDYVVDATWALSRDPRGAGRTFHLVDPNPMSARRIYELIARAGNRKLPKFHLPARATDIMLRLPVLERITRPQRAAVQYVNQLAIFNCQNTLELLDGTGIRCPALTTYLDKLIAYARDYYRRQKQEPEVDDPLDQSSSGAPG